MQAPHLSPPGATAPLPAVPRHIAVIMDGNRRWAREHGVPKALGHARGAKRVRGLVEACMRRGVPHLTVFAFSTENWKRPQDEVSSLMGLFVRYLQKEASELHRHGIRLQVIGERSAFDARLQKLMAHVEALTAGNTRLTLTIAANYGGRWDMLQAMQAWHTDHPGAPASDITEDALRPYLCLGNAPEPDLLIRTGGEVRISNFMLWQSAYTELYFTPALWPDFTAELLDEALVWYAGRERRFGGAEVVAAVQPGAAVDQRVAV